MLLGCPPDFPRSWSRDNKIGASPVTLPAACSCTVGSVAVPVLFRITGNKSPDRDIVQPRVPRSPPGLPHLHRCHHHSPSLSSIFSASSSYCTNTLFSCACFYSEKGVPHIPPVCSVEIAPGGLKPSLRHPRLSLRMDRHHTHSPWIVTFGTLLCSATHMPSWPSFAPSFTADYGFAALLAAPSPSRRTVRRRGCVRRIERYYCNFVTYFPLAFVYGVTSWALIPPPPRTSLVCFLPPTPELCDLLFLTWNFQPKHLLFSELSSTFS